jgi:hypothetical protein
MFSNIVSDVQSKAGVAVHYEHGHPLEIINTLRGMGKTPAYDPLKYPLIALFQDIDEKKGTGTQFESEVSVNIIIAMLTDPNRVASQRLSCNYIPVLYPLYVLLMESIAKSGYFYCYSISDLPHTKTDRMYWGKKGLYGSDGNIFGDYIDAIEIQNLQLTIKKQNCI